MDNATLWTLIYIVAALATMALSAGVCMWLREGGDPDYFDDWHEDRPHMPETD